MATRLTDKQRAFVEAYLETLNATEAARRVYKAKKEATFASIGSENLRKPKIRELIDERLREMAMSADEVLSRLTKQAKANFGELIRIEIGENGEASWYFDFEKVKERGNLVKSVSSTKFGVKVELYDAQAALIQLGKYHGLFTERVEHSGSVQQAQVNIYIPDNERGDRD